MTQQSAPRERLVKLLWLVDPYAVTVRIGDPMGDVIVRSGYCGTTESAFQCFDQPGDAD
jgi:hypothetical protein